MKVSIITVAYNAAETIEETLQSVASQTHPEVEYILIDGGSTDGTLELIERYRNVVDVLVSEPDAGIYDAMNKGVSRATGEVVGILNSDDAYADPDVVADVVRTLQAAAADACYADLDYVDRTDPSKILRRWTSGAFRKSAFKLGWMPPHPTFFLKKTAYERHGTYRTELRTSADYELMLRMLYKHEVSVAYLPRVIVKMKMGGQSNASLKARIRANKEDRMAWKMNNLEPGPVTFIWKPLRKLGQFFRR